MLSSVQVKLGDDVLVSHDEEQDSPMRVEEMFEDVDVSVVVCVMRDCQSVFVREEQACFRSSDLQRLRCVHSVHINLKSARTGRHLLQRPLLLFCQRDGHCQHRGGHQEQRRRRGGQVPA